jgi:hypothetical protein
VGGCSGGCAPNALRHAWASAGVLIGLTGCGSETGIGSAIDAGDHGSGGVAQRHDGSPADIDSSGASFERTYEPTLSAIYREIFRPTCAAVFCHKDSRLGFDASSIERSYETLVNVMTETDQCGPTGLVRVVPGQPSQSLLYLKLTEPPCGRRMPLLFDPNLDPRELEQIRSWIESGAPAN